jgi:hypothetical protein
LRQRSGMSLSRAVLHTRIGNIAILPSGMAIEVRRTPGRWPKRYHVTVTPPDGDWSTARPVGKQRLNWKMRHSVHSTDFWDLIARADERYEREQQR